MNNMNGMIQSGIFGTTEPNCQEYRPYNPYSNNIIPFGNNTVGNNGYNQYPQQYGYNQYPQQQPIMNYNNGYYQYQQPMMNYGNNQPVKNTNSTYYNPYGNTFNNSNINYNNGGAYYPNYRPYYSPQAMAQYHEAQVNLLKIKYRNLSKYFGYNYTEEQLEAICNPQSQIKQKTREEIEAEEEFKFIKRLSAISRGEIVQPPSSAQIISQNIMNDSRMRHSKYDDHGLIQFFNDDLWRIQEEMWMEQNCVARDDRNFSNIYDSGSFNELLKLHNSTNNSEIDALLDDSRYDNNIDDMEMSMTEIFNNERARREAINRESRRKDVLSRKVPEYVSSNEVMNKRSEYLNNILTKMSSLGIGGGVNV